jgi:tellurite methyltransferase
MIQNSKQTYLITPVELLKEYRMNDKLRKCLDAGHFVYVEEMLIVNDPEYIMYKDGQPLLTDFDREKLSKCALIFNIIQLSFPGKQDYFGKKDSLQSKRLSANENIEAESSSEFLERQKKIYSFINSIQGLNCWDMIGKFLEFIKQEKIIYTANDKGTDSDIFCSRTNLGDYYYKRAMGTMERKTAIMKEAVIAFAATIAHNDFEVVIMMREILAGNISRYRKALGLTQEALAAKLGITFQAVSKWETGQTVPDTTLLPTLAQTLKVSIDKLLGYTAFNSDISYYEANYRQAEYFWGAQPSLMCLEALKILPPDRRLKLLDIGCGEGKDAVFFARCGYDVSAFDISEAGLEKTKRLADTARVQVRTFRANVWDYRLDENYDVLYSSGVLHYLKPELRAEIMANYQAHVNDGGIAALQVFVAKPFVAPPPEKEEYSYPWKSGQLFTYFHNWRLEHCGENIFDCTSSGVPHQHADNRLIARKVR